MRVDSFTPSRPGHDPVSNSMREKFESRHLGGHNAVYDIYLVGGSVYVCREGCVGIYSPQGEVFIKGRDGKRLCEDFAKKYPMPPSDENTAK